MLVHGSQVLVMGSVLFIDNSALRFTGGGVHAEDSLCSFRAETVFENNSALGITVSDGGVYILRGQANVILEHNSATIKEELCILVLKKLQSLLLQLEVLF